MPREKLNPPPVDLGRVERTLRTRYWSWILTAESDEPRQLVELLLKKLPHIESASWVDRFNFGGVYVNGLAALKNQELPIPARVEYYEPKFEISDASSVFPEFRSEYILFHDDAIAVVYKPPHLPSMPAKEQRHFSLKRSLERELQRVVHMPSRLDVSAQGIVVVSTAAAAHAGLQRAFENRSVRKTYRFATHQPPAKSSLVVDINISESPEHPVLRTISESAGQTARTDFIYSHERDRDDGALHVITAHPITGRTHQIRVHAAASGMPIVGDNFYGGIPGDYLYLVSCEVSFSHPISGANQSFSLPRRLSPDWVWS